MINKFTSLSPKTVFPPGKQNGLETIAGEKGELIRNETVRVRVLRSIDQKSAVVLINGKEYTARTGLSLKRGDILDLKVKDLNPVPVLKNLGIYRAEPDPAGLPALLPVLDEDLWKSVYENAGSGKYSNAEKAAERLLSDAFESLRRLNLTGSGESRNIFIPLPVRNPDGGFTVCQLLLKPPRQDCEETEKDSKEKPPFKISLLIELTELGPIRADISFGGKKINGAFFASRENAKKALETGMPELVANLDGLGFAVNHMECLLKGEWELGRPLILEMRISDSSIDTVV